MRLRDDQVYRFGRFIPPLSFEPPDGVWEARDYGEDRVRLRWRGESGFHPGALVVVFLGLSDDSVEERWEELESSIADQMEHVGESFAWVGSGTSQVGTIDVEWRELRTTEKKPIATASAPCVITLEDVHCIWFESSARLSVVPWKGLTVTVLVTEQLCDCDLGPLPGRFDLDNELEDHLPMAKELLRSVVLDG